MTPPRPARLHVLLAREARIGLVIRHGPRNRACSLLWDRTSDTFQLGQWFKGRIYSGWCDISPDGQYWVYFALNGKFGYGSPGSWTALARVPYLKAIKFYPECGTWGGGGRFTRDGQYWGHNNTLHRTPEAAVPHPSELPAEDRDRIRRDTQDLLVRDGWKRVRYHRLPPRRRRLVYEKPISDGWVLWKLDLSAARTPPGKGGRGGGWQEHMLLHQASGTIIDRPEWEWADLDGERLVWAEGGKLFAGRIGEQGLEDERLLHDFNPMTFEAIPAPY